MTYNCRQSVLGVPMPGNPAEVAQLRFVLWGIRKSSSVAGVSLSFRAQLRAVSACSDQFSLLFSRIKLDAM